MSSLQTLLTKIESLDTQMAFNVISGMRIFELTLAHDPLVHQLITVLKEHPTAFPQVTERLNMLLMADNNLAYQHPHDVPIALYLYAIALTYPEQARAYIYGCATYANLWWAKKLAHHLQPSVQYVSSASTTNIKLGIA